VARGEAAELLGDFGVPEGQPAVAVGFEFEIAGLAVVLDLEAAAGDLGWALLAPLWDVIAATV
jgi:hypothetical protein